MHGEERSIATHLAYAQKSYIEVATCQVAVDAFLNQLKFGDDKSGTCPKQS